jgi:hypothetical protein
LLKTSSLLVVILVSSAAAFARDSPDAQPTETQMQTDRALAALAKMTDADSLAAAGLMSGKNTKQSLDFLGRATGAEPNRADLVWLRALRCAQLPPCDPKPIEHRLRELDPSNGAGWWGEIARAGAAHDSEGIDAALTAISRSKRVDIYWTMLIAHISRAVVKTKQMSLEESEVAVIGYHIARALQNGDNYLTEMIGVAIAKRVWPEDSPEWQAAAEERRIYEYRSKLYPKLEQRALTKPEEYLTLCAQTRREQDVFAAQLTAAGFEPNPPPL